MSLNLYPQHEGPEAKERRTIKEYEHPTSSDAYRNPKFFNGDMTQ